MSDELKILSAQDISIIAYDAMRSYAALARNEEKPDWDNVSAEKQEVLEICAKRILEHPSSYSPERAHEDWMTQMLVRGWSWGERANEEKKQHPAMLPFRELKPVEQIHGHIFVAVCRNLRKAYLPGKA